MKRHFSASLWREGDWIVAQCREIEVASQGRTKSEALANLKEALELRFTPPYDDALPGIATIEIELN